MNMNLPTSPAILSKMRSMGPNVVVSCSMSRKRLHIKITMAERKTRILNEPAESLSMHYQVYRSSGVWANLSSSTMSFQSKYV